jgi:8-hydroxy-5-deazaflavin:NADPH oxidoreductase
MRLVSPARPRLLGRVPGHREAVSFADVVALAVPWGSVKTAIAQAGPMAGKIIWDCTNALKPDLSGLEVGTDTSGAEIIASLAVGAKVVKGIPPFAELLHSDDPTVAGKPADSFLCGDDATAKAVVRRLLEALPADVVDAGPLANSRFVEPAAMLLVRLAYGLGLGVRISLTLSRG